MIVIAWLTSQMFLGSLVIDLVVLCLKPPNTDNEITLTGSWSTIQDCDWTWKPVNPKDVPWGWDPGTDLAYFKYTNKNNKV